MVCRRSLRAKRLRSVFVIFVGYVPCQVGMRQFHLLKNRKFTPTINIDKLFNAAGDGVYEAAKEGKGKDQAPVIDLVSLGYFKLLGGGQINVPVVVKAKFFSKLAEKKIKAAGGACLLTA